MPRRGFTLLEVVVSSLLLSMVMSAATALVFITSRALPVDDDPGIAAVETLRAIDVLNSELSLATSITIAEPNRIEFVIRDRDSDGTDDTILHQWSGAAGAPWTRTDSNRGPQTIVRGLASLEFSYDFSEDLTRVRAVHVRPHPQGSRASLMPATIRLINRPAAP